MLEKFDRAGEISVKKRTVTAIILLIALALCLVGGGIFVVHGASHSCSHYGCRVCIAITQIRAIVSDICALPLFVVTAALVSSAVIGLTHTKSIFPGAVTPVSLRVKLSS